MGPEVGGSEVGYSVGVSDGKIVGPLVGDVGPLLGVPLGWRVGRCGDDVGLTQAHGAHSMHA